MWPQPPPQNSAPTPSTHTDRPPVQTCLLILPPANVLLVPQGGMWFAWPLTTFCTHRPCTLAPPRTYPRQL